jgi:Flp pilus assembly pilin Flp
MAMQTMMAVVNRLVVRDEGQDLLEYGLLAVLIAVVVLTGVAALGSQIQTVLWDAIGNNF